MDNVLVSNDLNQRIKWYIRAHGHSSIGGLNLIWTFFNFSGNSDLAEFVQKAIVNFETFSDNDDVSEQIKVLEQSIVEIENQIESIDIEVDKKEEVQQILDGVDINIERIKKIIINSDYKEEINLSNVLDSTITELLIRYPNTFFGDIVGRKNAGTNIEIVFEKKGDEKDILVCGYDIQLLFYNLISNAVDAIIYGSCQGLIWVYLEYIDDHVNIKVSDDGEKISKVNLEKIKSRDLFTTKGGKHGSGLKIIYDIVEKYDAKLNVKSSSEKTTFTISIKKLTKRC